MRYRVEFPFSATIPDADGDLYTEECLEHMAEQLSSGRVPVRGGGCVVEAKVVNGRLVAVIEAPDFVQGWHPLALQCYVRGSKGGAHEQKENDQGCGGDSDRDHGG